MSKHYLEVINFLKCPTSNAWAETAAKNIDILLIDHANCEKKAAATAMNLLFRYTEQTTLIKKMARLAREELRHFEQVVKLMTKRNIKYIYLKASEYAAKLKQLSEKHEPNRLIDNLIISSIIEARSCERFSKLVDLAFDAELCKFYGGLLACEARHFKDYLELAEEISPYKINERVSFFLTEEAKIINQKDAEFRFHSGNIIIRDV